MPLAADPDAAYDEYESIDLSALEPLIACPSSPDKVVPVREVAGRSYAQGKWTLKEVLGHLADDERIFAYRALCVARGDPRELQGFDENAYIASAGFEQRAWSDLLAENRSVREATLTLLGGLPPEAWLRRGTVNGYRASARGLAFHIAGHELHHLRVLRERYRIDQGAAS